MQNVLEIWMYEIYKESSGFRRLPPLSSFELAQVILGNFPLENPKERRIKNEEASTPNIRRDVSSR